MNNAVLAKVRWAMILLLLACGVFYWVVLDKPFGGALFLTNGVLHMFWELRRGIPIRVPVRRKPIIIERLRYPNG